MESVHPLLKRLDWLPVEKRIEFKIALLAYNRTNGTAEIAAESLRQSPTISAFRNQLKTHLFCMAFPN